MRNIKQFSCQECGLSFERVQKPSRRSPTFCSRRCANAYNARGQRTYAAIYERWVKRYGTAIADQMLARNKARRSELAIDRNTGHKHSVETRKKISQSCFGTQNVLKGKTFEQFYGFDRAKLLSTYHSKKLKEGYATGRIKPTARSCSAPMFRGVRLRSLLEQKAIEFLEKRDGLVFGDTLLYEDPTTFVS